MTRRSFLVVGMLALAVAPSAAWAQNLLSGTLFKTNSPFGRLPAGETRAVVCITNTGGVP